MLFCLMFMYEDHEFYTCYYVAHNQVIYEGSRLFTLFFVCHLFCLVFFEGHSCYILTLLKAIINYLIRSNIYLNFPPVLELPLNLHFGPLGRFPWCFISGAR